MSDVTVITNNAPREILDAWDLSDKERAEFDYLNWDKIENGEDSASFVRFRGVVYDLGDLERWTHEPPEWASTWDAYVSDTFFSGVLFRFVRDDDGDYRVVCGTYYA